MSYDIVQEDVPPFVKRLGDQALQGSNNSIIILGTDRADHGPADLDAGLGSVDADGGGKGTGTIHMIAGRVDPGGDPDLDKDLAYIYLSMKTKADTNLDLTSVEASSDGVPSAIVKSDAVRVVFRKDIKIVLDGGKNYIHLDKDGATIKIDKSFIKMTSGKIVVDSDNIELGEGAVEHLLKGDSFARLCFDNHTHVCGAGGTSPPLPNFQVQTNSTQVLAQTPKNVTVK